jgi:hypothetical protein
VRGIEVTPGDIDVNVSDAYLAGELLDDLLITPIEELDGGWPSASAVHCWCRSWLGGVHVCPRLPHRSSGRASLPRPIPISRRNLGLRRRQRLGGGSVDSARAKRALSCT